MLTNGSGEDGDKWEVVCIFSTRKKAEIAKKYWDKHLASHCDIEEWAIDDLKYIPEAL